MLLIKSYTQLYLKTHWQLLGEDILLEDSCYLGLWGNTKALINPTHIPVREAGIIQHLWGIIQLWPFIVTTLTQSGPWL